MSNCGEEFRVHNTRDEASCNHDGVNCRGEENAAADNERCNFKPECTLGAPICTKGHQMSIFVLEIESIRLKRQSLVVESKGGIVSSSLDPTTTISARPIQAVNLADLEEEHIEGDAEMSTEEEVTATVCMYVCMHAYTCMHMSTRMHR